MHWSYNNKYLLLDKFQHNAVISFFSVNDQTFKLIERKCASKKLGAFQLIQLLNTKICWELLRPSSKNIWARKLLKWGYLCKLIHIDPVCIHI